MLTEVSRFKVDEAKATGKLDRKTGYLLALIPGILTSVCQDSVIQMLDILSHHFPRPIRFIYKSARFDSSSPNIHHWLRK